MAETLINKVALIDPLGKLNRDILLHWEGVFNFIFMRDWTFKILIERFIRVHLWN